MSKVKIPKQLFVVRQGMNQVATAVSLGFLHEYNPHTATGKKKMKTQLDWAYHIPNTHIDEIVEENDQWIIRGYRWEYPPVVGGQRYASNNAKRVDVFEIIDKKIAPQVWFNDPLPGFKVSSTVSRYSTSNKLWRIVDPRGVEFEISTDAFEEIVMNSTIVKGEIMDECVWVNNKRLALASKV